LEYLDLLEILWEILEKYNIFDKLSKKRVSKEDMLHNKDLWDMLDNYGILDKVADIAKSNKSDLLDRWSKSNPLDTFDISVRLIIYHILIHPSRLDKMNLITKMNELDYLVRWNMLAILDILTRLDKLDKR